MLLQPLSDLREEINRLMIAGSRFANNDPRLQKLLPIFEKMGEKAPVFQKISGHIEALLKAPTTESAEHLTALSTLLYAVLYTQGKSIVEGDITAQSPMMNIDEVKTPLTYLELQPTIEALTTTGSGRHEIITDAFNRGLIHDVRLYSYIARGIEDKYSEIADFVKSDIIPTIGAPLIPFLLQDFECVDNKANAVRIEILDELGYSLPDDMIQTIMDGNDAKLQVALIPSLSRYEQYLPLLFDAAKSKKKATKEAAYIGLARSQSTEAWDFILDALKAGKGNTLELLVTALQPLDTLRDHDAFIQPLYAAIAELSDFTWHDDYQRAANLLGNIAQYVKIFNHKHNSSFTHALIAFSIQLNAYNGQKNQNKDDKNFKAFSEQFDELQIQLAFYFGHLDLAEDDPLFTQMIDALLIQDHYAKMRFFNYFYGEHFSPAFIYHALTSIFKTDDLMNYVNHLSFLIQSAGISPLSGENFSRYYILYGNELTQINPRYADPRWADYFYNYCSTKEFLVMLRSAYTSRNHNMRDAHDILAVLNGLEPKDSQRMIDLLLNFIRFIPCEKIGAVLHYLEIRMGKAAHPIILAKIDEDIKRLANTTSSTTEQLNSIQQRILAQSQPE